MQTLSRRIKKIMTIFSAAAGIITAAGWILYRFQESDGWFNGVSCGISVFIVTFPFGLYAGERIMVKAFDDRIKAEGFFTDPWKFLELSAEIDTIVIDRSLVAGMDIRDEGRLKLKENSAEAVIMISGLGLRTIILSEEGEGREDFLRRRAGAGHVALFNRNSAGKIITELKAESRLMMAVYPEGAAVYKHLKQGIHIVMGAGSGSSRKKAEEGDRSLTVYTETENLLAVEMLLIAGRRAQSSFRLRIFICLAVSVAALPFAVWGALGPAGALIIAILSAGAGLMNILIFARKER